jgi:anti-anti-sigma factor
VAVVRERRLEYVVVAVTGVIDFETHRGLQNLLVDQLDNGFPRLVVDLRGVTICDSSGLAMFSAVHRRARASGGWLRLVEPPATMRRCLEITKLDRILSIFDSIGGALPRPSDRALPRPPGRVLPRPADRAVPRAPRAGRPRR